LHKFRGGFQAMFWAGCGRSLSGQILIRSRREATLFYCRLARNKIWCFNPPRKTFRLPWCLYIRHGGFDIAGRVATV
jgi:hypothetical protein